MSWILHAYENYCCTSTICLNSQSYFFNKKSFLLVEFHIEKWEALVNDKIKKLKHEMHTVISSLPSDIAKMSVQDYITNFVEPNEKVKHTKLLVLIQLCLFRLDTVLPLTQTIKFKPYF